MVRVADRNGALHSEKGIASKAARRKGKKTFGHLIGERLPGEGWKWEEERWERQNPNRNSFGINKQVLIRTPSFLSLSFPTRGASLLRAAVGVYHAAGSPSAPRLLPAGQHGGIRVGSFSAPFNQRSCLHPEDKEEENRETTVEMQGERAGTVFLCLFYLTLSLNIRSFYSLPEGCQAEEVTLRRKELAHTV